MRQARGVGSAMSAPDLYAEAVARVKCGWSIIPVRNNPKTGRKEAACKWTPFQKEPPTVDKVRSLFKQGGLTGLAVILGRVSGGLYARDFDIVESYQRWAKAYPDLATTPPTYETGRGFQVLAYRPTPCKTNDLGDGELRGANSYSVLPPSLHPSGRRYQWVVASPDVRVTVDPVAAGLARSWLPEHPEEQTSRGTERQRIRETEKRRITGGGREPHPR